MASVPLAVLAALIALIAFAALTVSFDYGYVPSLDKVVNRERLPSPAYDVWGRDISPAEAEALMQTGDGRAMLSPRNWAVRIDDELLELGREVFYAETFGNEIFITDVLGTLDGAITPWNVARAILALRGRGTDNLRVRLAQDVIVGERTFRKGEYVDTGLDVPRGSFAVLGMKLRYERGHLMAGITCALCHATVDPDSGKVLEGVTNADVDMGLLLALASNPGAYFARTDIKLDEHPELFDDPARTVILSDGRKERLPDPQRLNRLAREVFIRWPPGSFDTMLDGEAGPTRTPDAFTAGDHPYGWTGFSAIGPFRGLNTLGNNVHAFNTDLLIEIHMAPIALGLDSEVYLGTLLQNAARERYRYRAGSGEDVGAFYGRVDPRPGSPGLAHTQALPTYPGASALAPHGVVVSRHGHPIWHHLNALSAFQNTLKPPVPPIEPEPALLVRGREVFSDAGCVECHSGTAFTANEIVPASRVGTEPMRAIARQATRDILRAPQLFPMDAVVPVPAGTPAVDVPYEHLASDESIARSMGHDGEGGYKTKGLIGLYWHAPYLHAGDVAVGPDADVDLGVPGTLLRGIRPDPVNSLRALLDRDLRQRVIDANRNSPTWDMQIHGVGHEFWVDAAAGFDSADQDALIHYLILLGHHPEARAPDELR
ncbi:MAG: hypothetical protein LPJ87_04040 [Zoogloeaceae bacterium]|nr:hypothetical protein [Zoogloeaceae bacterium]